MFLTPFFLLRLQNFLLFFLIHNIFLFYQNFLHPNCKLICEKNRQPIKSKIIFKSKLITEIIENDIVDTKKIESNTSIVKGNKQTKEEIAEKARIRKQNQRERQKQIYGDEEYKRMKAKEIAEYRANKKE